MSKSKQYIGDHFVGEHVCGDHVIEVYYKNRWIRTYRRIKQAFNGVIAGAKYIQPGERSYWREEGGWYFEPKGEKVFCFLVRESWLGKPLLVLPEDVRRLPTPIWQTLPVLKQYWPDDIREAMRKWAKQAKRDKRGRFTEEENDE
ncbi:MAG TPA: hypothetical protein ENI81_04115 [Phycisphaerales bacterium]|nr:hypothetical protein [Phycisphaerales bacterium]